MRLWSTPTLKLAHFSLLAAHRKTILLSFACLGAASALLFLLLPSSSPFWVLSAVLAIISNVSFGASIVALNAYLPSLAKGTEEARAAWALVEQERNAETAAAGEDGENVDPEDTGEDSAYAAALEAYNQTVSRATARLSSQGIALGYGAGIAVCPFDFIFLLFHTKIYVPDARPRSYSRRSSPRFHILPSARYCSIRSMVGSLYAPRSMVVTRWGRRSFQILRRPQ